MLVTEGLKPKAPLYTGVLLPIDHLKGEKNRSARLRFFVRDKPLGLDREQFAELHGEHHVAFSA